LLRHAVRPTVRSVPGQTDFKGQIYHTGLWPKDPWTSRASAVVGTGATGIQVIQTIAPSVGSMKVFVRTPQYVIPMRNLNTAKDWEKWGTQFHQLKKRVRETFAGFDYDFDAGPGREVPRRATSR
jgi:acetone monooxygenase